MKKEELNYFEKFKDNAKYAVDECVILKEFLENYNIENAEEYENKVHVLENEADKSQHVILNYLVKDFLPPIEREDIVLLAHKIDDLVDSIDEMVANLNILNVRNLREDIFDFVELLEESCRSTWEMLDYFQNMKKFTDIKNKIIEVNKFEEKGDRIFQTAMKELYSNSKDPIEVIVWTTIYNCLENCFDSCESIADCVEEILLKNS